MRKTEKKVFTSVTMANYNHGHYIVSAIQRIAEQSAHLHELILIDDGSTDESAKAIQEAIVGLDFVVFKPYETNRGFLKVAKELFSLTTGNYIFVEGADDYVLPGFFQEAEKMLTAHPEAALFVGDPVFLDVASGKESCYHLNFAKDDCFLRGDELAARLNGGWIPGHTTIVKHDLLVQHGGYREELKWHCDWFAFLVLAFRYGICYSPRPAAVMRVDSNTYSANGRRNWGEQKEVLRHVMSLLQSDEHADVYPLFIRGRALNHFHLEIVRVLLLSPSLWDRYTAKIIKDATWCSFKNFCAPFFSERLKQRYRSLRDALFTHK
jgi:glycosyltransferase involved in cell wall biosynthesis